MAKETEKVVRVASPERSSISSSGSHDISRSRQRELEAAVRSVVTFNAGDDEEPPYHVFSKQKIWAAVLLVSLAATFSPLSSSIYFPAQVEIARALNTTEEMVNLSITTYLIAQGLSPSFWGPLADVIGRRQVLLYTLLLYTGANVGLALAQNATMLLVFRFIQAVGSSSTISVGAGVIADLAPPEIRGGYIGIFAGLRQISTAIAPVLGGLLGGFLGFRAIFWFLTIFSAVVVVIISLFLPETHRLIAGNGSIPLKSWKHRPIAASCMDRRKHQVDVETPEKRETMLDLAPGEEMPKLTLGSFFGPLTFLLEKDVFCALFFGACVYTSWAMVLATTAVLLTHTYHFNTIQVSLCFLANGVGCVLGSIYSGRQLNSNYSREGQLWQYSSNVKWNTPLPKKNVPLEFPIERARLQDAPLYSVICIVSLLTYGWSLTPYHGTDHRANVHIMVPLLAQFSLGFAATAVLNSNNTLTIDLYPGKSASATAVNNLARCSMGAIGVSLVDILLESLHASWLGVLMAGLVILGCIPVSFQWVHGKRWRAERASRIASRAASKSASRRHSRAPSPMTRKSPTDRAMSSSATTYAGGSEEASPKTVAVRKDSHIPPMSLNVPAIEKK